MQSEVSVRLADDQEFRFDLTSAEPMAHEAGRRWLDDQFTALDCEPLRASGKGPSGARHLPALPVPLWPGR